MRPITKVAKGLGISKKYLEAHGNYIAKVSLDALNADSRHDSKLVLVTAMTPTPPGEGKTTTSIGLVQSLAKLGENPVLTLRDPSMGPVFGKKGGGTGGGKSRVVPDVDINLHFTGDAHAVSSAHNFLAAIADRAASSGSVDGLEPSRIEWRRVTTVLDRSLRSIVAGIGGSGNAPMRETGFDIDAASEVMAVLALASGFDFTTVYEDLRERLARIVVGFTRDGKAITVSDVNAVGAMMALLKNALKPNLVQTLEGQPAFVHAGPFGNIAHGCNSIIADRMALRYGSIVVTEAGFGADLGFEKFMDIKARASGRFPDAAVVVATLRAVKWHGGVKNVEDAEKPNMEALERGAENMAHALGIVKRFGLPVVLSINRFPTDTEEELKALKDIAFKSGAYYAVENHCFLEGGEGARELAEAVKCVLSMPLRPRHLYELGDSIEEKVKILARKLYLAGDIVWSDEAKRKLRRFKKLGWDSLPVCMAKTHLSISADPELRGRPSGHEFPVNDLRISAGAGFVYAMAGDILTMPGLGKDANAFQIDLLENGEIVGVV